MKSGTMPVWDGLAAVPVDDPLSVQHEVVSLRIQTGSAGMSLRPM
jgi:hypothetical protein